MSYCLVLIITLMLSRIFSEAFMSITNNHNHKTFTKSPPASLLHFIENILNHSSGKCGDSLTMAALSFTIKSSTIQYLFTNISLATAKCQFEKKMIPIPLLVLHLVQAFGTAKDFVYLIT